MEKSLSEKDLDNILDKTDIYQEEKLLTTNEYFSFLLLALFLKNIYQK